MEDDERWGEWQCFSCGAINPKDVKLCRGCRRDRAKFGMRLSDFSGDSDVDSGAGCNG